MLSGLADICSFNTSNTDPNYVRQQLEEAIVDMMMDTDRYDKQEVADATDVLAAISMHPVSVEDLDEASAIIMAHLQDPEGRRAMESLAAPIGSILLGGRDFAAYQFMHIAALRIGADEDEEDGVDDGGNEGFDPTSLHSLDEGGSAAEANVVKSKKQIKADRAAAKKALRAATLEREASEAEQKRLGILESGKTRAAKRLERGRRRKERLERRAERLRKRAATLEKRATRRQARGVKAEKQANSAASRTTRWAEYRARLAAKTAARKRAAADKARPTDSVEAFLISSSPNASIGASIADLIAHVGIGCENCGAVGDDCAKCSGCKTVSYCSKECQHADWFTGGHNVECAAISEGHTWKMASQNAPKIIATRHLLRFVTPL